MLVQLQVTSRCNLRCAMCGQWGPDGVRLGACQTDLDPQHARAALEYAARAHCPVTLWGGEPLVYRHLDELARHASDLGVVLGVITNGTRIEQHLELLLGFQDVYVSIDAPAQVHDRIRGVEGTFERATRGLEALSRGRRERGALLPRLHVLTTVTADSAPHLLELAEAMAGLDADLSDLSLTFQWWTTPEAGAAWDRVLHQRLGVEQGGSWRGFAGGPPQVDPAALAITLAQLKQRRWPFKVFTLPRIHSEQDLHSFYTDLSCTFGQQMCLAPWLYALVLPTGELTFCPDYPDYTLGSLAEQGFEEIWEGERARAFRALIRERSLPLCNRCCWLYLAGDKKRPG